MFSTLGIPMLGYSYPNTARCPWGQKIPPAESAGGVVNNMGISHKINTTICLQ